MTLSEKWKKALWLYCYFTRIGCFTFGGGWSIIAQMQKDFVEDRHWISDSELLDRISLGRSLPGTMISNCTMMFGYYMCGLPGAFMCVLGICTMPVVILTALTFCYVAFRDNIFVARALVGVRAAVIPIMVLSTRKMLKSAYPYKICYCISLLGFVLCTFTGVSNALVVILGGICGIMLMHLPENLRGVKKK